ncbi:MAG: PilZ domain-containing protein [Candidatus Sedimenticola endophacoides]
MIEHRRSARKPISMDVVVSCRNLGLVKGQTLDVGLGGMFVETGRVRLPVNTMINVSVLIEGAHGVSPFKTGAMVVHRRNGGAGVMFIDPPVELQTLLRRTLYGQRESPDALHTHRLIH